MSDEKKNAVIAKFNTLKSNIESIVSDVKVNNIKTSLNTMVKDAQKDLNKFLDKDVDSVKKKLQKEKEEIEKRLCNIIGTLSVAPKFSIQFANSSKIS